MLVKCFKGLNRRTKKKKNDFFAINCFFSLRSSDTAFILLQLLDLNN